MTTMAPYTMRFQCFIWSTRTVLESSWITSFESRPRRHGNFDEYRSYDVKDGGLNNDDNDGTLYKGIPVLHPKYEDYI